MALRTRLPMLPANAEPLSQDLAVVREDSELVFWNASGPIYTCNQQDRLGLRVAAAMFSNLNLASAESLAPAIGVHRSTVFRSRQKFQAEGSEGLEHRGTGPRGAHKLSGKVRRHAQCRLNAGLSIRATAKEVRVSEGAIRYALRKGTLHLAEPETVSAADELKGPRERTAEDESSPGGVAVKRNGERALARLGLLAEAEPRFVAAEGVAGAGVLLALPALLQQGLVEVGRGVYGALANGFFGLRSVLLMLAFMVLLRIKTPEQLSGHAPGELGMLLGLDRAPEVKTLRRKLKEIGSRKLASTFAQQLATRWAEENPEALGFLYVDGHVRPYHGKAHTLPKAFVPRRRLAMPATTDYWANDEKNEPLFFITAAANDGLLAILEGSVLPEVRSLVGEERRVTMVFDREGWSPQRFAAWHAKRFDVLTYRKGSYDAWSEQCFFKVSGEYDGKRVTYMLGQRSVKLGDGFWMREVRKLCEDGHQLSVMTTRQDLELLEVANRMFARWRQENFFRYMRHEFGLDHLASYAIEPGDPDRQVPNPQHKEVKRKLKQSRTRLAKLEQTYGTLATNDTEDSTQSEELEGLRVSIDDMRQQCHDVEEELKKIPQRVAIKNLLEKGKVVRLERERKVLIDTVKLLAYRAETSLTQLLGPFFARQEDESRKFLKAAFQLPGDLIPDEEDGTLTVRLHGMANWRSNRALTELCTVLNELEVLYPGTDLRLLFRAL
jgi:hypothetical protein